MHKVIRATQLCDWFVNSFVRKNFRLPRLSSKMATSTSTLDSSTEIDTYLKKCARQIFDAGIEAVLPHQMVKDALKFHQNTLRVNSQLYKVDHNIHIVAFGKAVIGMVRAAEDVLGDEVVDGVASVPYGIQNALKSLGKEHLLPSRGSKVKITEGARNNLPDMASMQASKEIADLVEGLSENDILLVLVSGGGSALLPAPVPPFTLDDKLEVIKVLAARGATIHQLNTVRKNLSALKGGRLAALARPCKVISLLLSDIIGDRMDFIASGPTIPDCSTPQDCLRIFQDYNIHEGIIPSSVFQYLKEHSELKDGTPGDNASPPPSFSHVNNVIIGSNSIAVSNSVKQAEKLGFAAIDFSKSVHGEARDVAEMYVAMATSICHSYSCLKSKKVDCDARMSQALSERYHIASNKMQEIRNCIKMANDDEKPVCLIGAGETTVTLRGKGTGGRSQELALAASICMKASSGLQQFTPVGYRVVFLSAGTDGQDGPTDAAGAFADLDQVTKAEQSGLDAKEFLKNNNSYVFYSELNAGADLVVTGLTGTNVMDLHILLIYPPGDST